MPKLCKQLLKKMITYDEENRYDIYEIKNHDWFKKDCQSPKLELMKKKKFKAQLTHPKSLSLLLLEQEKPFRNMEEINNYLSNPLNNKQKFNVILDCVYSQVFINLKAALSKEHVKMLTSINKFYCTVISENAKSKFNMVVEKTDNPKKTLIKFSLYCGDEKLVVEIVSNIFKSLFNDN